MLDGATPSPILNMRYKPDCENLLHAVFTSMLTGLLAVEFMAETTGFLAFFSSHRHSHTYHIQIHFFKQLAWWRLLESSDVCTLFCASLIGLNKSIAWLCILVCHVYYYFLRQFLPQVNPLWNEKRQVAWIVEFIPSSSKQTFQSKYNNPMTELVKMQLLLAQLVHDGFVFHSVTGQCKS